MSLREVKARPEENIDFIAVDLCLSNIGAYSISSIKTN